MTKTEQTIKDILKKILKLKEETYKNLTENDILFEIKNNEIVPINFTIDSLDVLDISIIIEQTYGLDDIPMEDLLLFTTIKNLANYVDSHKKG